MDKKGSILTQVYTSRAQLPIENASVVIIRNGEIIAHETTNNSGKTNSVFIDTPDISESQSPGNITPFASVDIKVTHPGFYGIIIREVQVFPDTETLQYVDLIPTAETDSAYDRTETVNITPQNL